MDAPLAIDAASSVSDRETASERRRFLALRSPHCIGGQQNMDSAWFYDLKYSDHLPVGAGIIPRPAPFFQFGTENINNTASFRYEVFAAGSLVAGVSGYFLAENLLFGTAGGIVAKTCTAPLERLTTYRQASIDSKLSIRTLLSNIYREEGIAGFWRGNGLNVFRASIQKGSLFALNDFFKKR